MGGTRSRRVSRVLSFVCITAMSHACVAGAPRRDEDSGVLFALTTVDPSRTRPAPGDIVNVETPSDGSQPVLPLRLSLVRADAKRLEVRVFLDRPRPCRPELPQCPARRVVAFSDVEGADGRRTVQMLVPLSSPAPHCYRVDVYVAPSFSTEPLREEEPDPATPGDIAHVRYYVLQRDTLNNVPPLAECTLND